MYRIFCESLENYKKMFDEEYDIRRKYIEPLELIADVNKYNVEKKKKSLKYKKVSDLLMYMKKNKKRYPRFKAFLWTIQSRDMIEKEYGVSSSEEIEEQMKIVNSILKFAYW